MEVKRGALLVALWLVNLKAKLQLQEVPLPSEKTKMVCLPFFLKPPGFTQGCRPVSSQVDYPRPI